MLGHRSGRRGQALALLLALVACGPPTRDQPPRRLDQDKAALFGDPALVPTRQGELARTELALAADLDRQLRPLDGVRDLRVSVELPFGEREEPAVIITAVVDEAVDPTALEVLEAQMVAAAMHVVPATRPESVQTLLASTSAPDSKSGFSTGLGLLLALLGLGMSLGVTAERWWQRSRANNAS